MPPRIPYRPDIDGLRAIAIIPVVLYHLLPAAMPGGYIGVDVFFVISGYLITQIIESEIADDRFTIAGFYERRVRRIFPALFAMLALVLLAGWFLLLPSDYHKLMRSTLATITFSSNIAGWKQSGYFAPIAANDPLLHTWSLAVEEQFYLAFPLLLILAHRFLPRRLAIASIGLALASFAASTLLLRHSSHAVFYLAPFRAWELLAGCLLALRPMTELRARWQREACGVLGLALIAVPWFVYNNATAFPGPGAFSPVLGATLLIYIGSGQGSLVTRVLGWPPLTFIGAISYSLYLWHWPLIVLARFANDAQPLAWPAVVAIAALTVVVAVASWRFVERPFRNHSIAPSRRSLAILSAGTAAILCAVALMGVLAKGVPARFDQRTVDLDKLRYEPIAWLPCEGSRSKGRGCILGDRSAKPGILIWGDSHALSWGPAFDDALRQLHASAVFMPTAACLPLFGLHNLKKPLCDRQAAAVRELLAANRDLHRVILIGAWAHYPDNAFRLRGESGAIGNQAAIAFALPPTLQALHTSGATVLLMTDVPGARADVPLAMALASAHHAASMRPFDLAETRATTAFFDTVAESHAHDPGIVLVHVERWFCNERDCPYEESGAPLYRDDGHLSDLGAHSRAGRVMAMLEQAGLGAEPTSRSEASAPPPFHSETDGAATSSAVIPAKAGIQ